MARKTWRYIKEIDNPNEAHIKFLYDFSYLTNKEVLKNIYQIVTLMNDAPLTDEEVRNAFYSLKTNKSAVYDGISFNAINYVFNFIVEPLRYIFSNYLTQGIFPEEMRIARITLIQRQR